MDELAAAAVDALGTELAVVDADCSIVWASAAWRRAARAGPGDPLFGADLGADLSEVMRETAGPAGGRVADGIEQVVRGEAPISVHEMDANASRRWLFLVRALPSPHRGAAVMRADPSGALLGPIPATPVVRDVPEAIAKLTPRERDVLRLMVRGLDNRQIAAELGVAYTTVRSHTSSLIEKLGARSRLDAVARAFRAGISDAA